MGTTYTRQKRVQRTNVLAEVLLITSSKVRYSLIQIFKLRQNPVSYVVEHYNTRKSGPGFQIESIVAYSSS
jgi:hypothetical protein